MMAARIATLVGVAAALVLSPAGAARGAWSPPDQLSTGQASGTPTLAFDARGWALATWTQRFDGGRRSASRAPSSAAFRPDRSAPNLGEEVVESAPPSPVVDRAGQVIALQQHKLGPACGVGTRYALTPRFGTVKGSFAPAGAARVVFSRTEPPAVALAGNPRGAAVLVWREIERDVRGACTAREFVRAQVRVPGHGFGAPVTLARSVSGGPIAAAVGARGAVLVVWRRGRMLETRMGTAHGSWGPKRRVAAGQVGGLAAAVAADGSAHLAWTSWNSTRIPEGMRTVEGASRRQGARRFATTVLGHDLWPADLADRPEHLAVRLALLRHGAIAAWTSWNGSHLRVLTATSPGSRFRLARPSTPADADYALGDLAVSLAGRVALALRSEPAGAPSAPFAAFAQDDGPFGVPEPVASGADSVGGEALAFSPVTGRPTLVWTQRGFANGRVVASAFASTRR